MSRLRERAGCCNAELVLDDVTDPAPVVQSWRDTHPCPHRPQPDGAGRADVERVIGFTAPTLTTARVPEPRRDTRP